MTATPDAKKRVSAQELVGAEDQAEGQECDSYFAECANDEWSEALFAHFGDVGAETDAGESEQECPARKIREAGQLVFAENVGSGDGGDDQKAENEFREFGPEECGLVADAFGTFLARPMERVTEYDEADHGVARRLGEDGDFCGGVGVESAGSSDFGGVVDAEPGQ